MNIITRSLIILLVVIFPLTNSTAQEENSIKQINISYWGDSIINQTYELDLKTKKIYFKNPVANYLDIKGGKPKYNVNIKKKNRESIFQLLDNINFKNFKENEECIDLDSLNNNYLSNYKTARVFYNIGIVYINDDYFNYTFLDDNAPSLIKKLYQLITMAK